MQKMLGQVPLSAGIALVGVLVLKEWRWREQREALGWQPSQRWYLRNLHWLLAVGVPVAVIIGASVYGLPVVLSRVDDGNRDAVLIEGNGVELIWAPEGPGWNWKQPWGGYPSWAAIALYGLEPVGIDSKSTRFYFTRQEDMDRTGLCRYLSEDGLTVMEEPQDIWRMPTVDELVRSMALHGQNCGCRWDGDIHEQVECSKCKRQPDKETPLWNPDVAPIYYWAWNEYDADNAYYVSYNGWVQRQPKSWGNPRHGYRCVKEP